MSFVTYGHSRPPSWGKAAGPAGASAAAGACGSHCHSGPLSGCAVWRCWWSSRWRQSQDRPPDSRCWITDTHSERNEKVYSVTGCASDSWALIRIVPPLSHRNYTHHQFNTKIILGKTQLNSLQYKLYLSRNMTKNISIKIKKCIVEISFGWIQHTSEQQKDEKDWHARFWGLWVEATPPCTQEGSTKTLWRCRSPSLRRGSKKIYILVRDFLLDFFI